MAKTITVEYLIGDQVWIPMPEREWGTEPCNKHEGMSWCPYCKNTGERPAKLYTGRFIATAVTVDGILVAWDGTHYYYGGGVHAGTEIATAFPTQAEAEQWARALQ